MSGPKTDTVPKSDTVTSTGQVMKKAQPPATQTAEQAGINLARGCYIQLEQLKSGAYDLGFGNRLGWTGLGDKTGGLADMAKANLLAMKGRSILTAAEYNTLVKQVDGKKYGAAASTVLAKHDEMVESLTTKQAKEKAKTSFTKPAQNPLEQKAIADLRTGLHTSLYLLTRDYSGKDKTSDQGVKDILGEKDKARRAGSIAYCNNAVDALVAKGALKKEDADAIHKMIKDGKYGDALNKLDAGFKEPARKTGLSGKVGMLVPIDTLDLKKYYESIKGEQLPEVTCNGNDLVMSALGYASMMKWLPENANWKDQKALGKVKASPEQMELVKRIMYLEATTEPGEFARLIAGAKAKDVSGANAELQALIDARKEVPDVKKDAYTNVGAFQEDFRVKAAVVALGGNADYKKYLDDKGKYSVPAIVSAAAEAVKDKKTSVESPVKGACDNLEGLLNPSRESALQMAVDAGVLFSGDSRRAVKHAAKQKNDNVGGEVFEFEGKYYALSHIYATAAGVADPLVKKVGKEIANNPLGNASVQEAVRAGVKENVDAILASSGASIKTDADGKAISDYLNGSAALTENVKGLLGQFAASNKQVEVPAVKTVEELMHASNPVGNEIIGKGLGNAETIAMIATLNGDATLKRADGNLSVELTIAAIKAYAPGTAAAPDVTTNVQEGTATSKQVPDATIQAGVPFNTQVAWVDALSKDQATVAYFNRIPNMDVQVAAIDNAGKEITVTINARALVLEDVRRAATNDEKVDRADGSKVAIKDIFESLYKGKSGAVLLEDVCAQRGITVPQ
ncbi:MAG: hypothetical protein WC861_06030 [Candidatus Micrarchaeia archaeon]|jgi:hypothetical protein